MAVPIGWIDTGRDPATGRVWIGGDVLVPSHVRTAIAEGGVEPGEIPLEGASLDDLRDAVRGMKLRADERNEARNEGRAEEAARALLTALRVRGVAVPDAVRERILAQKDPARLESWLKRAIVAASLGDVLDEPS